MKYIYDITFWLHAALCIAPVAILVSSVRLRGKGLLLGFFILSLLSYAGSYVPYLLLKHWEITNVTYGMFSGVSSVFSLTGWALLLAFVVGLKSVQQTGGAIAGAQFTNESMTIARALFSFEGRLCRSDYWLKGFLPLLPVGIINNILAYVVATDEARAISIIIGVISLWPALALAVKRLHDRNRSAWFLLIPIANIWFMVEVLFLRGTVGPNRFGEDPVVTTT